MAEQKQLDRLNKESKGTDAIEIPIEELGKIMAVFLEKPKSNHCVPLASL